MNNPEISLYDQTPDHYDSMMNTELEINNFEIVISAIIMCKKKNKCKILDLCCGTGIVAKMLLDFKNIEFLGIDINHDFIDYANKRALNNNNFKFVVADVLSFKSKLLYDIIVMTSAYHHVKDKDKSNLLRKARNLLTNEGNIIIYEKAIANYHTQEECSKVNEDFYFTRIKWLEANNLISKKQFNALTNVCALSANSTEEYKVTYDYMVNDFKLNDFKIQKIIKTWPSDNLFNDDKVGDFVFILKKKIN